jgi:hypothetical protein
MVTPEESIWITKRERAIMDSMDGRVVAWFSCGAASAVSAYMAVRAYKNVKVVYCDTLAEEHSDNLRFLKKIESWIEHPIEIIASKKFKNVTEVWEKAQYMSGINWAPCSREMKKVPRLDFQLPNDLHIFGLTADEKNRIRLFEEANQDLELEWNLRDHDITKALCYHILEYFKIDLPMMYKLGFKNNNCIGCVKSSSPAYWNRVRKYFPEVFEARATQSRKIGCKLVKILDVRLFLDELPADYCDTKPEEDIECGVICRREGEGSL